MKVRPKIGADVLREDWFRFVGPEDGQGMRRFISSQGEGTGTEGDDEQRGSDRGEQAGEEAGGHGVAGKSSRRQCAGGRGLGLAEQLPGAGILRIESERAAGGGLGTGDVAGAEEHRGQGVGVVW